LTEQGHVKVTPFGLFHDDSIVFNKYYLNSTQGLFSPEQCAELQSRSMKSNSNVYLNETYQIAMTLLSCATLVPATTCYDYSLPSVKPEVVDFYLNNISQYYGKFFTNLLKLMLNNDLLDRPSPTLIATILAPYEMEILSLQKFSPNLEVLKQQLESKGAASFKSSPTN